MKTAVIIIVTLLLLLATAAVFFMRFPAAQSRKDLMQRYVLIVMAFLLLFCLIIVQVCNLMYVQGDKLRALGASDIAVTEDTLPARRGNLYADDGKMLSSSLPHYKVYMDMKSQAVCGRVKDYDKNAWKKGGFADDATGLQAYGKELADSLATVFGEKPAARTEADLWKAYRQGDRRYRLLKKEISHTELQRIKKFPLLWRNCRSEDERFRRTRPYHPLASRTIGDVYGIDNTGKNGLELFYNDSLRGHPGKKIKRLVAGKVRDIVTVKPLDGVDLTTTLNVDLQETAYKALKRALEEEEAECGTAVLMQCATGEIKAICNLVRQAGGLYTEARNVAFGDEIEPGSTFKTLSLMVALDDGVIDTSYRVDTGEGRYKFYGSWMRDTHANGTISVPDILAQSSNIGVSRIIDDFYRDDPQRYIDGLHRTGIDQPVQFEIPGHGRVRIKESSDRTWAKTSLPWMSIGYEVSVPPICTLMFYNAIANGGRMVKPKLVRCMTRDGDTLRVFPTEVVNERICKPSTLGEIQAMLRRVVTHGTGKQAESPLFAVAGKTGTSQIQSGGRKVTDEEGRVKHNITFCGYFPADAPQYSCIVYVKRPKNSAAGRICGSVFREIAERAYALQDNPFTADKQQVRQGRERLREQAEDERAGLKPGGDGTMPDLTGRTAREALYLLESEGWRVRLNGEGRVAAQSAAKGTRPKAGETITLTLR